MAKKKKRKALFDVYMDAFKDLYGFDVSCKRSKDFVIFKFHKNKDAFGHTIDFTDTRQDGGGLYMSMIYTQLTRKDLTLSPMKIDQLKEAKNYWDISDIFDQVIDHYRLDRNLWTLWTIQHSEHLWRNYGRSV